MTTQETFKLEGESPGPELHTPASATDPMPLEKLSNLDNEGCLALAESYLPRLKVLEDWMDRKKNREDRRAFIVEFAGMPKAGKSLAIENLRHFFSHGPRLKITVKGAEWALAKGYRVHTPAEGVSCRTPNYFKHNRFHFNAWSGAYALQELLEACHDDHHDIVILDRGPWDAGCWLQYAAEHFREHFGDSPQEQAAATEIVKFFQSTIWMVQSDVHLVLVVDPATALARERQQRLIQPQGPSADRKLMDAMRSIYEEKFHGESGLLAVKSRVCPHIGDIGAVWLDTTVLNPKHVALLSIDGTLRVLEAKMKAPQGEADLTADEVIGPLLSPFSRAVTRNQKSLAKRLIEPWVQEKNSEPESVRLTIRTNLLKYAIPPLSKNRIADKDLEKAINEALSKLDGQK